VFHIARNGAISFGSVEGIENARLQFERSHCVLLSKFLEPALLEHIQAQVKIAEFDENIHQGIGIELCMRKNSASGLLEFLTNDDRLFQLVQQITRCQRIACFNGRVYQLAQGSDLYDSWHDDLGHGRMVAMSINLSTGIYRGGILQIRDTRSRETVHEVANVGFGDAVIFRLARHLKHRVTDVEGATPRIAFAGWFQSEPDFLSLLKEEIRDPR
jgi:hypothetical protein